MYEVEASCRGLVASLLAVNASDIAFVSSASRGLDLAIQAIDWRIGDNVVSDDLEFPTNIFAALKLKERGVTPKFVRSKAGSFSVAELGAQLDERSRLVIVSLVSFNSGMRIDLDRLAEVVHSHDAYLFIDATQAFCAIPIDATVADFLVASPFKWALGVPGATVFYVNPRLDDVTPAHVGWKSVRDIFAPDRLVTYSLWPDARRFEEGMPSYPALYVLQDTLSYLIDIGIETISQDLTKLTDRLLKGLLAMGVEPLTPLEPVHRAGIVSFESALHRGIVDSLSERNIFVWGREGRVRISPHFYNSANDIDCFLNAYGDFRTRKP